MKKHLGESCTVRCCFTCGLWRGYCTAEDCTVIHRGFDPACFHWRPDLAIVKEELIQQKKILMAAQKVYPA